jgi:hypothetical protein
VWAEYHRRQAKTLVNLALLTENRDTAMSLLRMARQHAEKAMRAEARLRDTNAFPDTTAPSIQS